MLIPRRILALGLAAFGLQLLAPQAHSQDVQLGPRPFFLIDKLEDRSGREDHRPAHPHAGDAE